MQRFKKKMHRQDTLDDLNWPNVRQLIYSATLNLAKSAIEAKSSEGLNNLFVVKHTKNPRKGPNMRLKHRGKITQANDTFSVNATEIFNKLPMELKIHNQLRSSSNKN